MKLFPDPPKPEKIKRVGTSGAPRTKVTKELIMPPIPVTPWRVPDSFPDLSDARLIAIDTETYDPDIKNGPGFVRGKAHIVGVSIATDTGYKAYFPVRHELGGNLNATAVMKWLSKQLGRDDQIKIGHNLIYDLEALMVEGVTVKGPLFDTLYASALLNEAMPSYSLGAVADAMLGEQKEDVDLYRWLALAYGGEPTRKAQGKNIYRGPVSLVGVYAEQDAALPLKLYPLQKARLIEQGLWDLAKMEMNLINLYLRMRKVGVRVDVAAAEMAKERLNQTVKNLRAELGDVEIWSADSLARFFKFHNVSHNISATGKPSFTLEWFSQTKHPVVQKIAELRKLDKFIGTFVDGYILNAHVNGRIHGQFHPLRSEQGGTVSGRLSSSCPNLQNIPARDEELGPMIRSMFIPEDDCDWCSADYSQIEPRILLHYANGEIADMMRDTYANDKDTDFYDFIVHLTGVTRRNSKTISLGSMYGMGRQKLADQLGMTFDQASKIFDKFHSNVPFLEELTQAVQQAANGRGYIKTILNRRARFDLWESTDYKQSKLTMPLPYADAQLKWNNVRRAGVHKALNRLIQGSAADIYKAALNKCWNDGIFDVIPLHLMVHDENDCSVPRTTEGQQAVKEMIHIMETVVPLRIPLKVEYELAENWGKAK